RTAPHGDPNPPLEFVGAVDAPSRLRGLRAYGASAPTGPLRLQCLRALGRLDRLIERRWAVPDEDLSHDVDDGDGRAAAACARELLVHLGLRGFARFDVFVDHGDAVTLEVALGGVARLAPVGAVDDGDDLGGAGIGSGLLAGRIAGDACRGRRGGARGERFETRFAA